MKKLRSLGAGTRAVAVTLGVQNRHFITCVLHQPTDTIEVLVADSLNGGFAANRPAVKGLLAWVDNLDGRNGQIHKSFQQVHENPLAAIQNRSWTLGEIEGAIKFLEDCEVIEKGHYGEWRKKADAVLVTHDGDDEPKQRLRARLKLPA